MASLSIDSPYTIENNFGLCVEEMHETLAWMSVQLIKAENTRISLVFGSKNLLSPVYGLNLTKGTSSNIVKVKHAKVAKLTSVPTIPNKPTKVKF